MKKNENLIPVLLIAGILFPSFIHSEAFTDPFILPKLYASFFILGALLLVCGLVYLTKKHKTVFPVSYLDAAVAFFTFYQVLRILLTPDAKLTYDNSLVFLLSAGIYFFAKPWLDMNGDNPKRVRASFITFTILYLAQASYGLLQFIEVLPRFQTEFKVGGSFGNPGPYSNLLASLYPFALGYFLYSLKKNESSRYLAWIALLLTLVILPLTKARSAWIAVAVSTFYILYIHFEWRAYLKKWFHKLWMKSLAVLLFIGILGAVSVYLFKFKEESASGRLFIWNTTLQMVQDKPVFGHGYDQFLPEHNAYQAEYFRKGEYTQQEVELADSVSYAFNDYLQLAAESGILGLMLFLGIIYLAFFKSLKSEKPSRESVFLTSSRAALLAFLITALFSYPYKTIPINIFLFLILAIVSANGSDKLHPIQIKPLVRRILSIVLVISVLSFVINQNANFKAAKEWKTAFEFVRNKNYQEAQQTYDRLYPTLKHNPYFLFNYGAELSVMGQYQKSIKILREAEPRLNDADVYIYLGNSYVGIAQYEEALTCFQMASDMMPVKFYPQYRMVKIYLIQQETTKALSLAREILAKDVKVPSAIITGIRKEMEELVNNFRTSQ